MTALTINNLRKMHGLLLGSAFMGAMISASVGEAGAVGRDKAEEITAHVTHQWRDRRR